MFRITWNDHSQQVESASDVDRLLDGLHAQFSDGDSTFVTVELETSCDSLSIGLGRDLSVLSFVRGNKNPPYLASKGEAKGDETIEFRFGGEWSEIPMRSAIAIASARDAVRYFCNTGQLPEFIEWEEV